MLLLLFAAGTAWAQIPTVGTITTFAGSSIGGFAGDNGLAINAKLSIPMRIAFDSNGNCYVADSGNNRVRKIDKNGIITTVAGNGNLNGASGDNGPATNARVSQPSDVAVDNAGNLYIVEFGSMQVRKVGSDGIIHTIAGTGVLPCYGDLGNNGPATSACINPVDIALDAAGNIYLSDSGFNLIWKITSDGIIHKIAGGGCGDVFGGYCGDGGPATSASLNFPHGLTVDPTGNVYFADSWNNVVRKIDTNGIITRFAGTGEINSGYSGDGGPATSAQLHEPRSVSLDSSGNIFIADYINQVVRKVTPAGIITTVAGNGTQGYSGDGGPAISAQLNYPNGTAFDAAGNLYIADNGNNRIRKVQLASKFDTTVALTSSSNPSMVAQQVTFTATVTSGNGIPTGTVTFMDSTTTLGTDSLDASGKARYSTSSLLAGTHSITAVYSGNSVYSTSASAALSQVVNQGGKTATTIAISASTTAPFAGASVTFAATVTGGTTKPTGTVTFKDGSAILGTGTLDANAKASYASSTLTAGTHSVSASYAGDSNYTASDSSAVSVTVRALTTSVTVTSSANPSTQGQSVAFTATATSNSGGVPTGTVTFKDGSTALGTVALDASGKAAYSTSSLSAGTHSITAVYGGDSTYPSSSSTALSQTVNQATKNATTTTLTVNSTTPLAGASVTFTATVTATGGTVNPTGSVTFKEGNTTLGTGTLDASGKAAYATTSLAGGAHSVSASYAGDTNNNPSNSSAVSLAVQDFALPPGPLAVTVAVGQTKTTTFAVSPVSGFTGTITFACVVPTTMAKASCSATPVQITGTSAVNSTLSVTTSGPSQSAAVHHSQSLYANLFCAGFVGLMFNIGKPRNRKKWLLISLLLVLALVGLVGCGGGSKNTSPKPDTGTSPGTYNLTLTASSGSATHSMTIPVTVQ